MLGKGPQQVRQDWNRLTKIDRIQFFQTDEGIGQKVGVIE